MKLRKLNRVVHRDLGFIFFGMTVIYAISGIALNHLDDWNPNYVIQTKNISVPPSQINNTITQEQARALVKQFAPEEQYKNHYFPAEDFIRIFIKNGNISLNMTNGEGRIETTKRRPFLHQMNYLHYNPKKWWTWFSDIYATGLFLLAVTGLFIIRGKKGITGRGAWLTGLGILIPLLFLFLYYW